MVEQGAPLPFDMPDIQAKFEELLIQIASGFSFVDMYTDLMVLTWVDRIEQFLHVLSPPPPPPPTEDQRIRGPSLHILLKRGRAVQTDFLYLDGLLKKGEYIVKGLRRLISYTACTKSHPFLFVIAYFICITVFMQSLLIVIFITLFVGLYLWPCLGLFDLCGVLDLRLYIMLNYFHYIVL